MSIARTSPTSNPTWAGRGEDLAGRLVVASFVALVVVVLGAASAAPAHYVGYHQKFVHSVSWGMCVQTKVAHGEVGSNVVAQARTWARLWNGNCDNTMNRSPGQITTTVQPTRVASSNLEAECSYSLTSDNTVTTSNHGEALSLTPSQWNVACPRPSSAWRLASVSTGRIVVYGSATLTAQLYAGTNTYSEAHPT